MPTIDGVLLTQLSHFYHPKGDIFHAIKKSDKGYVGFGEVYFTTILPGAIKGWSKHLKMTLNLVVPIGKVEFVVFDDREFSQTKGQFYAVELSQENYCRLTISPGLWLAFKGKSNGINLILDLLDIEYEESEKVRINLDEISYSWI